VTHDKIYFTGDIFFTINEDQPHLTIVMCDSEVGEEDEMLLSEIDAAVQFLKRQL
jgi:hypothetical protein